MWAAVLLVGLAAACHAGFSANLYTIVSDTVPRKAVSSVVGIGGTAGCVGMVVFSTLTGYILDWTNARLRPKGLLHPFPDCRLDVSGRHGRDSPAAAAAGADDVFGAHRHDAA